MTRSPATLLWLVSVIAGCGGEYVDVPPSIDLAGSWYEAENYPDSGTLRLRLAGGEWIGTYVKVGKIQREEYNFRPGETVIRGRVIDGAFAGEVLIKYPPSLMRQCPNATDKWTAIRMRFRPGLSEMTGGWRQFSIDPEDQCERYDHGMQTYTLRRTDERRGR